MTGALRVALIASNRFPIRQPFAGGLEAHVYQLARGLAARGCRVSLFAAPDSDPALEYKECRNKSQAMMRAVELAECSDE